MAPLKKRFSLDSLSSSASPPSSAPISKKLKATTETFASSPIATSIAIATASNESSSFSPVRSVTFPEIRGSSSYPAMQGLLCSAGSATENRWVDGEKEKNDETHPIPSRALPFLLSVVDITAPLSSYSALSDDSYYQMEKTDRTHHARIRAAFPPPPLTRDGRNPLGMLSRVSSWVDYSDATRRAEVQPSIIVTANRSDAKQCYVGDRHPITGHRHGQGGMTYPNGCQYAGQFVNDMRHGHGKCWYPQNLGVYTGQWYQNDKHGVGSMVYANGDVYNGTWHRNIHSGQGTLTMKGGKEVYAGEFANNKKHGRGILTYCDNNVYSGTWSDDVPHGEGMLIFANGASSRRAYYRGKLVYPLQV